MVTLLTMSDVRDDDRTATAPPIGEFPASRIIFERRNVEPFDTEKMPVVICPSITSTEVSPSAWPDFTDPYPLTVKWIPLETSIVRSIATLPFHVTFNAPPPVHCKISMRSSTSFVELTFLRVVARGQAVGSPRKLNMMGATAVATISSLIFILTQTKENTHRATAQQHLVRPSNILHYFTLRWYVWRRGTNPWVPPR